jgi:diguanylate cyclase (GGDEF)-like protein/PAS domain S-box-containing protein
MTQRVGRLKLRGVRTRSVGDEARGVGAMTHGDVEDDLTRLGEVVGRLRADRTLLRAIFDRSPVAAALVDSSGLITQANVALSLLLGRPASTIIGRPVQSLTPADGAALLTDGHTEQRLDHALGHEVWVVASAVDLPEAGHGARLVSLDDATSRRQTEKILLHAALHDSLTDLPNRRLLSDRIETALHRAERSSRTVAVLFIDLDSFKKINDRFGHDAGDAILVAVARNIISVLRTCDTVARIGGDEFVVLCEDVSSEGAVSLLVGRLLEAIRRPVQLDRDTAIVSASIGVAVAGTRHENGDQLVRMADLAMYRAKHHPEFDFVIADETLLDLGAPRAGMLADLRHAIQADELLLHYQPVVRIDGHLLGLEALVRWRHPRMGMLLPNDFLHLAQTGALSRPLSDWVLRTAIAAAGSWRDPTLRVSVNVWASEIAEPGFADKVASLLTWAGLQASGLYIEMHESELATAGPGLSSELDKLRVLGVGLAFDDYGRAGSSPASLSRLPVDTVKIDRAFVARCLDDPADAAVVESVAVGALATGRHLIASGVENREQLNWLRRLGYHGVQGHLVCEARPIEDLHDVIHLRHVDVDHY